MLDESASISLSILSWLTVSGSGSEDMGYNYVHITQYDQNISGIKGGNDHWYHYLLRIWISMFQLDNNATQ